MPIDQKKIDVIRSNQFLTILDELGVGAFTVDLNRKVKSMNLAAQDMIGGTTQMKGAHGYMAGLTFYRPPFRMILCSTWWLSTNACFGARSRTLVID